MASNALEFEQLASQCTGGKRPHRDVFAPAFAGPECVFLAAAKSALKNPQAAARFSDQLDRVSAWVDSRCKQDADTSLPFRWAGIKAAFHFLLGGNVELLGKSVTAFNEAIRHLELPVLEAGYPSPTSARVLQKYVVAREFTHTLDLSLFAQDKWTAGVFVLHDWLLDLTTRNDLEPVHAADTEGEIQKPAPQANEFWPTKQEATPILSVRKDQGEHYLGSVQKLVAEQWEGPHGLILPDFFSLMLVAFPKEGTENFAKSMDVGFRAGLEKHKCCRLRWTIQPMDPNYPDSYSGKSAQVAAASCTLALADSERVDNECTLDERTAVTACLGPSADSPEDWLLYPYDLTKPAANIPDSRELREVEEKKLWAKFEAAACARLVAVLVCESQLPQTPQYDVSNHTTLIQPVRTLEDAHDGLRVMSSAVRKYLKNECEAWPWIEAKTPDEYIEASQRNNR